MKQYSSCQQLLSKGVDVNKTATVSHHNLWFISSLRTSDRKWGYQPPICYLCLVPSRSLSVHWSICSYSYSIIPLCFHQYGMTALLLAARHGDFLAVQILLTSDRCDVNVKDKVSVLDYSAISIKQFIWLPKTSIQSGWTALHHCALNNHTVIAEMLLVAGADPWVKGKVSWTIG